MCIDGDPATHPLTLHVGCIIVELSDNWLHRGATASFMALNMAPWVKSHFEAWCRDMESLVEEQSKVLWKDGDIHGEVILSIKEVFFFQLSTWDQGTLQGDFVFRWDSITSWEITLAKRCIVLLSFITYCRQSSHNHLTDY